MLERELVRLCRAHPGGEALRTVLLAMGSDAEASDSTSGLVTHVMEVGATDRTSHRARPCECEANGNIHMRSSGCGYVMRGGGPGAAWSQEKRRHVEHGRRGVDHRILQ